MSTIAIQRPPRLRPRPSRPALALLTALAVVAGTYLLAASPAVPARQDQLAGEGPGAPAPAAPGAVPAAGSLEQIDHSIRAWTTNLAANDRDFYSATNLGLLYDARGRLTGDVGDYQRAREALDRALAIFPAHLPARLLHARILQTTHDFAGALAEADVLLREDPHQVQALATAGDARLELGDLDGAAAAAAELARLAPGAPVTARLSRLAFLRGDPAGALTLASRAFDESRAAGESGPALGWYAYLAGTTALATGDPAASLGWFQQAVGAWPGGYLPLAGQARAEAALGRFDAAIELYRQAIAIAPQPDGVTALGDLYALQGDARLAADQYALVEAIGRLAQINEQVYNRQLVLFAVNHHRDVAAALRLAERELQVRKDVYGYDAYAWALLANGRAADADAAMRQAQAAGTQDSLLDDHAGMIALALADRARATALLSAALGRPGALDPLSAAEARRALEGLR
jgi:tetratricopeptide (TPR) repeat protein